MEILVLNGPNLDLLGTREPEVYGSATLADLESEVAGHAERLGAMVEFTQSNHEGDLIEAIHAARSKDGIVINPGAFTHTSRALGDAIAAVEVPTVEVHISNVREREAWRAVSLVSGACARTIYGRGLDGYRDALRHLVNRAAMPFQTLRYGPHHDNVGDWRSPTGTDDGLVVIVHGGFWRPQYERDLMETLAIDLTRRGWATWNLEYRRLGLGGGWPASGHDVLTALDHAGRFSDRVSVIGHSAGGHLSLWAAGRARRPPMAVIGLAPVTDLGALSASVGPGSAEASALLSTGAPLVLEGIGDHTLLLHGDRDQLVPLEHSTRLQPGARVEVVGGAGHFELLDPTRAHWDTVLDALGSA